MILIDILYGKFLLDVYVIYCMVNLIRLKLDFRFIFRFFICNLRERIKGFDF